MEKQRKKYHAFPFLDENADPAECPLCQKPLIQAKLLAVLYDGLNEHSTEERHKIPYCGDCHMPFLGMSSKNRIELEHPGFHLETFPLMKTESAAYLAKKISTPAAPVRNVPKGTLLFIGDPGRHSCGADHLIRYDGILHGNSETIRADIYECDACKKRLISVTGHKRIKNACPDYIYASDAVPWDGIYPDKKTIFLLNVNQYAKQACPSCGTKLMGRRMYFKNDENPQLLPKSVNACAKCGRTFGRVTSFRNKPYSRYRFSMEFFQDKDFRKNGKCVVLKAGDFLTRHNLSGCLDKGHSLEDITARIRIAAPDGTEFDYDAPAMRCDTCGKLFLLEREYEKITALGVPLCPVVENEYWRTKADGEKEWSETDAKGSILYVHGYNVNINANLTSPQRRSILKALLDNEILTKGQILSHLDTLIARAGSQDVLKNAKQKWIEDRNWVGRYDSGTEAVSVKSITHRSYHIKN